MGLPLTSRGARHRQDVKNGKLRDYNFGAIFPPLWRPSGGPVRDASATSPSVGDMLFNYGAFPQTWEDPQAPSHCPRQCHRHRRRRCRHFRRRFRRFAPAGAPTPATAADALTATALSIPAP